MQRAFNAWNYNHYWQPLKEKYCRDCKKYPQAIAQYEQVLYPQPMPEPYSAAKFSLESKFSDQPKEMISLLPAYWGIFRISDDTFETTKEMYQIIFSIAKILFYLWFIIIPLGLFFFILKQRDATTTNESLFDSIMENIVAGVITLAQIMVPFRWWGGPLLPYIVLLFLCYLGYSLSFKSALKYPKFFWVYGLCYLATPIIYLGNYTHWYFWNVYFTIVGNWEFLIIYLCCLWGGLNGSKKARIELQPTPR